EMAAVSAQLRQVDYVKAGTPGLGGEGTFVEGPALDLELLFGLLDLTDRPVTGDHLGDGFPDAAVTAHLVPELGDHGALGSRALVAGRPPIGESHIVEHRLLGRRLRLLVPSQDRKDD